MDEVNKKAVERLGDILDAIMIKLDGIKNNSNSHDEDRIASETILNLTYSFDEIYRNIK